MSIASHRHIAYWDASIVRSTVSPLLITLHIMRAHGTVLDMNKPKANFVADMSSELTPTEPDRQGSRRRLVIVYGLSYCQDNLEFARSLAESSVATFVAICAGNGLLAGQKIVS